MSNGFMAGLGANLSQDGRWLPVIATSVDPATQADIHALTLIDVVANTTDSRQIFSSQPTITSPLKFGAGWKECGLSGS